MRRVAEEDRAVAGSQQNSKADESRMNVESEDESRTMTSQNTRRRLTTKSSMEESQAASKGKRRITSKTSLEGQDDDKAVVAVTSQGSPDAFSEKSHEDCKHR